MSDIRSCLYRGMVTHQRLMPFQHRLAYGVYSMLLDLNEVPRLDTGSAWFGFNRWALLSFCEKDHGLRDGSSLLQWVRGELDKAGLPDAGHRISIICFPRVLGYVFNPLSVYFCRNDKDQLRAILYEVKNTFGEQHGYLFPIADSSAHQHNHGCAKEFYVSPFIEMKANYAFTVTPPANQFHLLIRQDTTEGELLRATWNGQYLPWSDANLKHCFWCYPLLTFKIMFAIHWHALKLWLKKAKFRRRPKLPEHNVTIIKPTAQ